MNTIIGVYDTHEKALEAVEELKSTGYPIQQISLIGKSVTIDDLMHVQYDRWKKNIPAIAGAIVGPILGLLSGIELFAIPGLGFLYGIGPTLGALAGFSLGLVVGGAITLIAITVFKSRYVIKYRENVKTGFQLIAHGNITENNKAKAILNKLKPDNK